MGGAGILTQNTSLSMACSKFFSFSEIVKGRDSSVRVTDDGLLYAVDLTMVMTGLARDQAGLALRRSSEKFQSIKMIERQLSSHGGHRTKLVSFDDAIELVMVLPGKVAKETRCGFRDIIKRYLAGDMSLISEINANASSSSPIAQLARASLPEPGPEDPEARRKRIKREDLELIKLEHEIEEMRASTQEKRIKNFHAGMALMTQIRPDWMQTDARFRLQTEDMVKNIVTQTSGPILTLTNGEPEPIATPVSLSISQLVQELGGRPLKHADACRAGALAAKRFRAQHEMDPPKHRQWVDGAERIVNSYTEYDRELLTAVLSDLCLIPTGSESSLD